MKLSIKNIILWIAMLACLIAAFSVFHDMDFTKLYDESVYMAMTNRDILIFKVSSAAFFILLAFGLFVELNFFHLKEKLPLFKSAKLYQHILAWVVIFLLAMLIINGSRHLMSSSYQQALNQYNKQALKK